MKKFFSLVLALVMALSLTTVAWGAELDATPATWDSVLASANDGATINLAAGTYDLGTLGAGVAKDLTIVGTTGTYVTYLGVGAVDCGNLTVKNCTFKDNTVWCFVCIEGSGVFTFDNCTFVLDDATSTGSAIYLAAQYSGSKEYVIKNCSFAGEYTEGAVVVQNSAPSTVTVSGNDFSDVDGDGLAVWFKDSSLDLTSDVDEVTLVSNAAQLEAAIAAADAGDTIKLMGDVTLSTPVAVTKPISINENGNTLTGLTAGAGVTTNASGKLTSGTFAAAPDADDVADGYSVLKNTDGTYIVVLTQTFGDKFDLYLANVGMQTALKNKTPAVPGLSFEEVGAKKNADGSGRVAYIAANNGQFFVKTTNPTVADYAVTYAGKTDVLYYVTVAGTDAANFYYDEEVKAFNNWGLKCGQINNTGWTTAQKAEDYFMASDYVVYMAAPAGVSTNYLLDGVVVSGVRVGTTIDHHFVASNFKYDAATGANVPTSAICTTCTQTTTAIYKIGKAPANAVVKPLYVEGRMSDVWEVVPVATSAGGTTTPSTDKTVTSAETFDAGIAMYVGMSVMAAAGSAVVIGKKKD